MRRSTLLLLPLLATPALADAPPTVPPAPRIAGATKYPPHALVRLKAENVDPKAGLLWRVHPAREVLASDECRLRRVEAECYRAVLGRDGEPENVVAWVKTRKTIDEIRAHFYASEEYLSKLKEGDDGGEVLPPI